MTTVTGLRTEVSVRYERLALPSWPDPHPGPKPPRDEEYSRVTDPGRYAVVHARSRIWAEVLAGEPGVDATGLVRAPLDREGRLGTFDRGVQLSSSRPGTLPLLLLERDAPHQVLHLSVVRPEISLDMVPYCGCDACDDGSDQLLEAIDETVSQVVGGPTVVLRGAGWHAQWRPDGASAGSDSTRRAPRFEQVQDWCRRLAAGEQVRLPRGTEAFVGGPWFE